MAKMERAIVRQLVGKFSQREARAGIGKETIDFYRKGANGSLAVTGGLWICNLLIVLRCLRNEGLTVSNGMDF
jgi:hypothetical protein